MQLTIPVDRFDLSQMVYEIANSGSVAVEARYGPQSMRICFVTPKLLVHEAPTAKILGSTKVAIQRVYNSFHLNLTGDAPVQYFRAVIVAIEDHVRTVLSHPENLRKLKLQTQPLFRSCIRLSDGRERLTAKLRRESNGGYLCSVYDDDNKLRPAFSCRDADLKDYCRDTLVKTLIELETLRVKNGSIKLSWALRQVKRYPNVDESVGLLLQAKCLLSDQDSPNLCYRQLGSVPVEYLHTGNPLPQSTLIAKPKALTPGQQLSQLVSEEALKRTLGVLKSCAERQLPSQPIKPKQVAKTVKRWPTVAAIPR